MASQTTENYLKALFTLSGKSIHINLRHLAQELGVSLPTANAMVKKLADKGWVVYEKYKPLQLTPHGVQTAALIVRKHRLTEMYLVEKMGFGWEEVHEIAEQMEHIKSERFFDRIDELLGSPHYDPHGSPIPDKQGHMQSLKLRNLAQCTIGETVQITALEQAPDSFLKYLNSKALALGTSLSIIGIEAFDHSLIVAYHEHPSEPISAKAAQWLLVKP